MESGLWREWKEVTEETEPLKKTEILRRNIRAQKGQASGLGLLPKIGGVSFDLDSLVAIRQIHERDGVSESHVVRSCAGIGLPVVQDVEIHAQIKRAAERYCTDERQVIQNAVRCGLEQWEWEREWDGPPGSGVAVFPASDERWRALVQGEQIRSQSLQETAGKGRRRGGKYPARIGGLAFPADDHQIIQRISSVAGTSDAHVVRMTVAIGIAEYTDPWLRSHVEQAALRSGERERTIFYAGLKQGLDEAITRLRVDFAQRVRSEQGAEDTELELKLTEYILDVKGRPQPLRRLPDPLEDGPTLLDDFHRLCSADPHDDLDRAMATYLDHRDATAYEVGATAREVDSRRHAERRAELLELGGRELEHVDGREDGS